MANNKIYGEHYLGVPLFAPYEEGNLVRNPEGDNMPPRGKTKKGLVAYNRWEKKYFSDSKGRPKKYHSEEERKEARKRYARKYYLQKKEKERKALEDKIKIIGE